MKLLQSLILLIGIVTGVNLKDERYTGEEQKRSQTYVQYFNTYLEPALPAQIQDLGGKPSPPKFGDRMDKIEEIKTWDGASSAEYGDGTNVQTSAVVVGIVVLLWLLWRILPVENGKNASYTTLLEIQRNC